MDDAEAQTQIDTADVRVTKWSFTPGAHRHAFGYVVVPLTDGTTRVAAPDGTATTNELTAGAAYHRPPGARHDVTNIGPTDLAFVEIEYKHPAPRET